MELAPNHLMKGDELFQALAAAPYVEKVEWKESKTSQGNEGNHYMEQNIKVFVVGFPKMPLEFELSRHDHMKEKLGVNKTVTALFKTPPPALVGDAWRILMHVVRGKELLPSHAQEYCQRALKMASVTQIDAPADASADDSSPGSASVAAALPAAPPLLRSFSKDAPPNPAPATLLPAEDAAAVAAAALPVPPPPLPVPPPPLRLFSAENATAPQNTEAPPETSVGKKSRGVSVQIGRAHV